MLPKSKIKIVQSLKHKKNRINSNLFLVEGIKSFDELLKSNYKNPNNADSLIYLLFTNLKLCDY